MIRFILKSQYRSHIPCLPVDHDEFIDIKGRWLQPTEDGLAHTVEEVDAISQNFGRDTWVYFPARLTQAPKLPEHTLNAIGDPTRRQIIYTDFAFPLRENGRRWLDFSQFKSNPYFIDLFRG
jgi:hypothetical protein